MIGRKHHFTQQFALSLKRVNYTVYFLFVHEYHALLLFISFHCNFCNRECIFLVHLTKYIVFDKKKVEEATPGASTYKVLRITPLGEVDKNKSNFNLNFTSFIRSGSMGSELELDTPNKEDEDESGMHI